MAAARLELARRRLEDSDLPIEAVARECGFQIRGEPREGAAVRVHEPLLVAAPEEPEPVVAEPGSGVGQRGG